MQVCQGEKDGPDTMIMSPKFANSMSFARLPFDHPIRRLSLIHRYDGIMHVQFARDEKEWLRSLVNHVENAPQTHSLKIALAIPSIGFGRDDTQYRAVAASQCVATPRSRSFQSRCNIKTAYDLRILHLATFAIPSRRLSNLQKQSRPTCGFVYSFYILLMPSASTLS